MVTVRARAKEKMIDELGRMRRLIDDLEASAREHQEPTRAPLELEAQYSSLIDQAWDAVVIAQDDVFKYVNRAMANITGYEVEELLGLNIWSLLAPASQRRVYERKLRYERRLQRRRRKEGPLGYSARIRCKDGTIKDVQVFTVIIRYHGRTAYLAITHDVSKSKRAEANLRRSEARLRLLSRRVIEVQEEERTRIARELHDQLGQELVALKIEAVSLAEQIHRPELTERARAVVGLVDRLRDTTQRISLSLRPGILDELGLVKAVQWYSEEFERRSGISCPVETPAGELVLTGPTATAAYRILQEALTNVWKHSCASQAKVAVAAKGDKMSLSVSDNGVGVDVKRLSDASSLGLLGMRERSHAVGGTLSFRSRPGKGTRVTANLPCKP